MNADYRDVVNARDATIAELLAELAEKSAAINRLANNARQAEFHRCSLPKGHDERAELDAALARVKELEATYERLERVEALGPSPTYLAVVAERNAALAENERLRVVIEAGPHDTDCVWLNSAAPEDCCDCWKRAK